jgi:hypothetical protein
MERSIDTARRRRLHDTEAPAQSETQTQAPARARPMAVEHPTGMEHQIPRRKARPKRATPTLMDGNEYRAKAV